MPDDPRSAAHPTPTFHVFARRHAGHWLLQPQEEPEVIIEVEDLADGGARMREALADVHDVSPPELSLRISLCGSSPN